MAIKRKFPKPGLYVSDSYVGQTPRFYYFTGTAKGNKWYDVSVDCNWMSLSWVAVPGEEEFSRDCREIQVLPKDVPPIDKY